MTGINPISYQPAINKQIVLTSPEVLFSNKEPQGFSEDSFIYLNKQNNDEKPFNFVPDQETDKSIIGTVGNLWNKMKNNVENLLDSNTFKPENKQIIETRYKDIYGKPVKLNREAAYYYDRLVNITRDKGIDVKVSSSYRTVGEQKILWERALKKYKDPDIARKWVAPPGKSQHNFGNAIDMELYRNGRKLSQSEFDKVIKEAGFYRPLSWETWHIEPISTAYLRKGNN